MEKNVCIDLTVGSSSAITKKKIQEQISTLYRNVPEACVIARPAGSLLKNVNLSFKIGKPLEHAVHFNREIKCDFNVERNNEHSFRNVYDDGKYDFVNAKCQLLVNPSTDITELLNHPDNNVSWVDVAEVRYFQIDSTNCPICLYPPVAPRMGPCGHVYCLPCVWQFIEYENDILSKKCAVCSAFLRKSELKRVILCPVDVPCVGQSLDLILIRRNKSITFPLKLKNAVQEDGTLSVSMEDLPVSLFSRVSIATSATLENLIQRDIDVMETYIADSKLDAYNLTLVPIAEEILITLMSELNAHRHKNQSANSQAKQFPLSFDEPDRLFTYYEDVNGLDIYLHSSNWRCLVREYTITNLPECISGQVVEVECHIVTYEFRRRYRYLSHLPIGRSVFFVELDLKPPIVTLATLMEMSEVIDARRIRRQHKLKIEKYLTRTKEKAENRIQSLPLDSKLYGHVDLQDIVPTDSDFVALSGVSTTNTQCPPLLRSFASVSKIGAGNVVDRHRIANFSRLGDKAQWFETVAESWPSLGASLPQTTSSSNWVGAASNPILSLPAMDTNPPLSEAVTIATPVSAYRRRSRRQKTTPKLILDLSSLSFINSPP